jgi:hypothetical protein
MKAKHIFIVAVFLMGFFLAPLAVSAQEEVVRERVSIDWDYEMSRLDRLIDHLGKVIENPEYGNWLPPDLLNLLHQRVRFLRLFTPNLGKSEYDWPPLDTLVPNVNRVPSPIPKL